ncbi:Abc transporter a family member [Thalictrum thalictroides]|uniref:Abc transporter a family member n=1 Tax=Thalictrum thalictroides TaxID=46969 RepID=A0A7J6WHT3_THATH|nr:Abc transporter a family member [Thalictrum thalictroides]
MRAGQVLSFRTADDVNTWLFYNQMQCPGALHFEEKNASVISYGVQTNSTVVRKRGMYEDSTFKFRLPLQIAAEREIARFLIGDPNFSWVVALKEFPYPTEKGVITAMKAQNLIGLFILASTMFGFVFQINALVLEKQLKLRQAMSIMGLYQTSYWLSWLAWESLVTLLSALTSVIFGRILRLSLFSKNNFAVVFLVIFLFQFNLIGFAFMLSTLIPKASAANTIGFSLFIVFAWSTLASMSNWYADYSKRYKQLFFLIPSSPFGKAIADLGALTPAASANVTWSKRTECPAAVSSASESDKPVPNCFITINGSYKVLVSTFFLWFFLAIYFDNVMPNPNGVRKSLYYFLKPGYWTGEDGGKIEDAIPQLEELIPDDEDVLEEENIVKKQAMEGFVDPNVAVQIQGLRKTYPGKIKVNCCKCNQGAPFHAVKGLWVNFPKDQLFCLLGPNGAGKTTSISCLTGITPVTAGDALIYGHSVRSSIGMSNIQRIMGVCPQFDILWDVLSGKEHLHLFASIKGLPPSSIPSLAENSLAEVQLTEAAKMRSRSYSGGMKRRLSVAIALIGNPKLVLLDEPTTGMDPISRRHVWDIIQNAKKGRSIILTTHSMEEADILADRIAIMAKGKLRCIGTSIRLKSRFGTGFITNISFTGNTPGQMPNYDDDAVASNEPHHKAVKQFFENHLGVVPKEENKAFLTFVIPHEKEGRLTKFFAELQDREREFGIADIQLGLTTLEEVFLNIAKKSELETALEDGITETLTLTSGNSIEVPVGARFVGIPGTESEENPNGLMVEVYWEMNEDGSLCISGQSPETPIPPNVRSVESARSSSQELQLGSAGVRGFLIDASEIEGSRHH